MSVRSNKRLSITRFIAPLASLMILGYFGFHAFNGHYGIRANVVMEAKIVELDKVLKQRIQEREYLASRVALLREGTMERDMIDEQVRRQLGMARPDEIVLMIPKGRIN